jgi:thymidylate synthase (FAD)
MSKLVKPETYWTGTTVINVDELYRYLKDTDQESFIEEIKQAKSEGLSDGEILCSFYAKACYAALTTEKNKNISRVRGIHDNVKGTIKSGHGSVFEHCQLNFMIRDCSRVFTHELVRHRVGTAFSQTSGRYVRTDSLDMVYDPILDPAKKEIEETLTLIEQQYQKIQKAMDIDSVKDFGVKKKITSAMRRILPNGQANEIGFSVNLRSLRHTITMRTSAHAEWEIRVIFNQIFELVKDKYPAIFADAIIEEVDGLNQITFENEKI